MHRQHRHLVFLAGIFSLLLTAGLARFAYTPLLPIMTAQAGLSYLAGGWLATFNYLGYLSGVLLAASISQLRVKFHLYRIGLIVSVISTGAMGLTQNVYAWAVLRYVAGLTTTCGMLVASGLIMNWLLRNRLPSRLGLHFSGIGLGVVVSGVIVGLMAPRLPWNQQWLCIGLLGALFLVPAWTWMPEPGNLAAGHAHAQRPPPSRRWMQILTAAYFCGGFGYVVSATFMVAILEKLPVLTGHGSWVWVIVGLAATPSTFLWDHLAHRLGQIPALILAYGLQIVSVSLPVVTHDLTLNLIGAILYGNTFVGIVSLALSLIGRHFPDNPAKAMARLTLSYGLAQIIAPAMTGYIATASGSYQGALEVVACVMGLGMILLYALNRLEQRESPQSGYPS